MKTIDIQAKEWFDKVNGNSYFSGLVTVNYGLKDTKSFVMPFQYGYGEHYIDTAKELLKKEAVIDYERHENGASIALWQYCRDNKIILRYSKQKNCKKRDLTF